MSKISTCIKESIPGKTVSFFANTYSQSKTKKCFTFLSNYFKDSFTGTLLHKYTHKDPLYKDSFIYFLIMKIASLFDIIFGFINKVCTALLGGSLIAKTVKNIYFSGSKILTGIALLVMSACVGALISMMLKNNFNDIGIILVCGGFGLATVLGFIGIFIVKVKESFIGRVIAWFLKGLEL
ncbi:MAG: hypothetical protein IJS61_09845 [Firmicutes bacterium]|nr:hypothetical protein [Bacillota bacterium]